MADDTDASNDEAGYWNCSLCTYKNQPHKSKCEICDLRRGTSTRKPRCNADTIVAQVVKQQEQIRQQTRAKPSPKNKNTSSAPTANDPSATAATSSNDSTNRIRKSSITNSQSQHQVVTSDSDESIGSPKPKKKKLSRPVHKASRRKVVPTNNDESDDDTSSTRSDSSNSTSELSHQSPTREWSDSRSESEMDDDNSPISPSGAGSAVSPSHSSRMTENPFKITPFEINGNLIKYSPPTSTGRTGLIIDKKRFTQHSVTVNDVTITFTEFATRQNKYIRKKKRRDDRSRGNGHRNGRVTVKTEAESDTNNISTATHD